MVLNNSTSMENKPDLWVGYESESSVDGETVHSESSNVVLLCSTSCYFSHQLHGSDSGSYWLSNIWLTDGVSVTFTAPSSLF